ncbi:hypothetical protein LTR66_012869, partial [Elasticomyces elasticus]
MPSSTFVFTSAPSAKEDVLLASLIPDKRYPGEDALAVLRLDEEKDVTVRVDKNFKGRMDTGSDSFFKAMVTRLFSMSWESETNSNFQVSADEGRIYALRQPKALFKQLCTLAKVRKWLQEGYLDKQDTYFVIGYRTLLNAKLIRQDQHSSKVSAQGQVPIGAAGGVDPTPEGGMNVEVAGGHGQTAGGEGEFETLGERIYAICYRKVDLKFFEGVDSAFLKSGNHWKSFSKTRGNASAEDETLEADIEDEDYRGDGVSGIFAVDDGEEIF